MAILTGLRIALWDNHQKPDPTHPSGLLRTRRERPRCRRPAEYRNELAPSHCLPRGSGQGIVPAQTSTLEGVGREVIRCLRWVKLAHQKHFLRSCRSAGRPGDVLVESRGGPGSLEGVRICVSW